MKFFNNENFFFRIHQKPNPKHQKSRQKIFFSIEKIIAKINKKSFFAKFE